MPSNKTSNISNISLSNDSLNVTNITPTPAHIPLVEIRDPLAEISDVIHFVVNPASVTPDSPLSIRENIHGIINPTNYQSPKIDPDGRGRGRS